MAMTRRHRFNRKGQALVEFALVLPLVLLLVVGMLEFARAWNLHQTMTDAVREGARRAVLANTWPVDSTYAPMWRYVEEAGYDATYASMGVCDVVTPDCGTTYPYPTAPLLFKKTGDKVTVTLSVPYRIWILGNRALTLKTSMTVRNE
jgi:Flp pilus assembly protein TadG